MKISAIALAVQNLYTRVQRLPTAEIFTREMIWTGTKLHEKLEGWQGKTLSLAKTPSTLNL